MSLQELKQIVDTCTSCRLHQNRKQALFGRGPTNATLMVVGEAPNKFDDESNDVFSGREGAHLNELLQVAGIPVESVYSANVLKCKAEPGRQSDDCPAVCVGYLRTQIALIKPSVVVCAGKSALQHLLFPGTGHTVDVMIAWVGKHLRRRDLFGDMRFAVIYHPSYLQRNKSPADEELCLATLADAWRFATARASGAASPPVVVEDLASSPVPMWQSRSLWR